MTEFRQTAIPSSELIVWEGREELAFFSSRTQHKSFRWDYILVPFPKSPLSRRILPLEWALKVCQASKSSDVQPLGLYCLQHTTLQRAEKSNPVGLTNEQRPGLSSFLIRGLKTSSKVTFLSASLSPCLLHLNLAGPCGWKMAVHSPGAPGSPLPPEHAANMPSFFVFVFRCVFF